ncbi:LLM class flavin-dependent oxidoreductase [Pseudonocardia sp. C8]|uniref:LLM class flavin-dependent oxidoreductase n=1 Tax=Pseudonocardia sp. C8 TaxID=2762759 RepID=UPI001642A6F5|nr:LLM class flavin-dependent oxidoreductase [Pseudonocardia sp. C8]MBC3191930.1 LLM class flavin-dependent oxidoreductase [Pseudonocardia sp. C8]
MTRELVLSVRVGAAGHGTRGLTTAALNAEAAGFDQVWAGNDIFGPPGIAGLASMLMSTSRIKVGAGVLDPVSLHPAQIAQLASGFQELSDDRFLLGLGAGSDVFLGWGGLTPIKPVPRTRQAVIAIRELTHGRSPAGVPGAGDFWAEQARIQQPRPVPIYVGAMGPRMLEMTGRFADGALPLCLPPRQAHRALDQIRTGAEKEGRSVDDLDVAACIWCSIDADPDVARRLLARHIAHYSGSLSTDALVANGLDPDEFARTQQLVLAGDEDAATETVLRSSTMLDLGVVGGAAEVVEQCATLIEAGARHLSFGPPMGPDPLDAVALLGKEVLPVLRSSFDGGATGR